MKLPEIKRQYALGPQTSSTLFQLFKIEPLQNQMEKTLAQVIKSSLYKELENKEPEVVEEQKKEGPKYVSMNERAAKFGLPK